MIDDRAEQTMMNSTRTTYEVIGIGKTALSTLSIQYKTLQWKLGS